MRMIDLAGSSQRGTLHIIDTTTSVDCAREVGFRRSFRSLVECMVPYCCGFHSSSSSSSDDSLSSDGTESSTHHGYNFTTTTTTVTGTFFGYRKGRVSFCLQDDSRSSPLLLLEFAVPTAYLAKEMQYGLLRIALECDTRKLGLHEQQEGRHLGLGVGDGRSKSKSKYWCSIYNVPAWSMYCNGRKVGYAMRRQMKVSDLAILKLMQSVSVGAGVLPMTPTSNKCDQLADAAAGDLMYLRASFKRVIGSADSHSFHMINPAGSSGQELSIFLLRSS